MLLEGCAPSAGIPGMPNPEATYGNLSKVTKYWIKLMDANKLPELSAGEHGAANVYELTKDVRGDWLKTDVITKEMCSDIEKCKDAYLMAVKPDQARGRNLRYYFFCVKSDGTVEWVSAYHEVKGKWVKLSSGENDDGKGKK